jgi:hypothetical protein
LDTLSIRVDRTGLSGGDVTVEAMVFFTDGGTGQTVSAQGFTGIVVQDSAELRIERIRLSQIEATAGQEQDWSVIVVLVNNGGSAVALDSSRTRTFLSFSLGLGWSVQRPLSLGGGGWTLAGGKTDSLHFIIDRTGSSDIGACEIHAAVTGTESNTGRTVSVGTAGGGWAVCLIESPADLRIFNVETVCPNRPYVNTGQEFKVRVTLENAGGDGLHNLQVTLNSDGSSIFLDSPIKAFNTFNGGAQQTFDFSVQAASVPTSAEVFTVSASGFFENTGDVTPSVEDTTMAVIQNPASLFVPKTLATVTKLMGGQKDPWQVKVAVRNLGQAGLLLSTPRPDDLGFWVNSIYQVDYSVNPPAGLKRGGLVLAGGATDTLVYTVTSTGSLGGSVEIRATVTGRDRNTLQDLTSENTTSVSVQSIRAFRIISTQIDAIHRTDAGNGYVNLDQDFRILVILENGLGQTVKNIEVQLRTNGRSTLIHRSNTIQLLKPSQWDSAFFQVHADTFVNSAEIFTARIGSARLETVDQNAPVGVSLDSVAQVIIQSPASLSISLAPENPDALYSTGQVFSVRAMLQNHGTAELDAPARVRLVVPDGYRLLSDSDTLNIFPGQPVDWSLSAPDEPDSLEWIRVNLERIPNDLNTGNQALAPVAFAQFRLTTVASQLLHMVTIVSPEGAKDGVLSTGQRFVVKTHVEKRHVRDVVAQIQLPAGYRTADNIEKSVLGSDPVWQVEAPQSPSSKQAIQIMVQGKDSLQQEVTVSSMPASVQVTTVSKAELELDLAITDPLDVAKDNTVSLGQEFVIRATVSKFGDADTLGPSKATLETLPNGYSTLEPYTKTLVLGWAVWTIKAPAEPSADAVNISVRLTTIPLDENSGQAVILRKPDDAVPVTIEGSWLSVAQIPLPPGTQSSVVPAQGWVKLMILELDNRGVEGANRIVLESLRVQAEDRFGQPIPPSDALSALYAVDNRDTNVVYGVIPAIGETNPQVFYFSTLPEVPVEENREIALYGTIATKPTAAYFGLNLSSGEFVSARDADSQNSVPVKNPSGEDFVDLRSDPKKIFQPETEPVLWNSPNPFGGPGKETTKIAYYLERDTDVIFRLYTLVGELVWSVSFASTEPNGRAGLHVLLWNGTNGSARKVLNGVYFLFMKTADGTVRKTKIAVLK